MRQNLLRAALLLPSVLIATACSTNRPAPAPLPEQRTQIIYPAMPPTKCARAPTAPAVDADDASWALYKHQRDDAGDDCRDKLDAVDAVVGKWPQQTPKEN